MVLRAKNAPRSREEEGDMDSLIRSRNSRRVGERGQERMVRLHRGGTEGEEERERKRERSLSGRAKRDPGRARADTRLA